MVDCAAGAGEEVEQCRPELLVWDRSVMQSTLVEEYQVPGDCCSLLPPPSTVLHSWCATGPG